MNVKSHVLNCPIDICSSSEALELVREALNNNKNFQIVTINPEMIMNAQKNPDFFKVLNNSELNIADGVGVRIALKLKGVKQAQIRGVDFARELIKLASENNLKIGFLGAKEDVIQKTKDKVLKDYPNLNIAYLRNGYFDDEEKIIEELKLASPQILLVGLGSPFQEFLNSKLKNVLDGCIMIGVGGSFDVISGSVQESPLIYQKLGLEWLYRTISQPERIKRIIPALPIFLIKCIIDSMNKKGQNIENIH